MLVGRLIATGLKQRYQLANLEAYDRPPPRRMSPFAGRVDVPLRLRQGRVWHIAGHTLEKVVDLGGNEAMVQYECKMPGGKTFRNVEVMAFDGDQVRSVNVYFGATYKDGKFVKWE